MQTAVLEHMPPSMMHKSICIDDVGECDRIEPVGGGAGHVPDISKSRYATKKFKRKKTCSLFLKTLLR